MKSIFTLIVVCLLVSGQLYSQTGCCPYISGITILPSNPTTGDFIKIVTSTTTPNLGNLVSYSYTQIGDTFYLEGCFYSGLLTVPQTYLDTTDIGILAAGTYHVDYLARMSTSTTLCIVDDINFMTTSFQVTSATGIENLNPDFNFVSIYPNPASGLLTVKQDDFEGKLQVELINCFGQVCFSNLFTKETTIDLSGLANGIYIITLANEKNKLFRKVVKQ